MKPKVENVPTETKVEKNSAKHERSSRQKKKTIMN